ncbi:MAG: ABC transporter permease [Gammaproteobacteria bacterium]|nr:ABC transporter permease [Gammaproteobacteria bacterium]
MLNQVLTISKFTIIESMRNRLLWLSFLMMVIGFVVVEFVGELAITEHLATQVSVLAVFLRLSAVLLIALFVVSSSLRELQDKTLEMILAMSVRRSSYYLGKLAGYILLAVIVGAAYGLLLMVYAPLQQVLIWIVSLVLELVLVVALALVMLFTFKQTPAALTGVFIVYLASRVMASFYLMSQHPIIAYDSISQKFIDGFVAAMTWVLPDLNRYTQTEWLVYGTGEWQQLWPILMQTMIYLGLLSSVALFDFYRKNF